MMEKPEIYPADQPIPVTEEVATVSKRTVMTGAITVEKQVQSREYEVTEVLQSRQAMVERVPKGTPVDAEHPPQVRTEDGVLIIPVLEEILVVEKRLVLKEELHIRQNVNEALITKSITLKNETVVLKRTDGLTGDK